MNSDSVPLEWWYAAAAELWLPSGEEMAAIDRAATTSGAIPERALIENAGRALASRVQARWPEGRVVALAGSGHNGADALVAARTLHAWGRDVELIRCGSRPPEPDVLAGWGLDLADPSELLPALGRCRVVLDGILGTGVRDAPREPQAGYIREVNGCAASVVAVDGPSGVDFSRGVVPGDAIEADLTVTFGWPKLGLLRFPARARCGEIEVVEIGFPPVAEPSEVRAITASWAAHLLRVREATAHKGQAGYLAIAGGDTGMAGAVILAARAALRTGAGIVRVVSHPANREIVQTAVPSAVFVGWDDPPAVERTLEWAHALAIGPGLGSDPEIRDLARRIVQAGVRPQVIDADGLNAWEGRPDALADALRAPTLLTPHPGEARRLLDGEIDDPLEATRVLARATGATVLLKGTPTWVGTPDGRVRATVHATPAFATGGAGDLLTGVAGALLASGLEPWDAGTVALAITGGAALGLPEAVGYSATDIADRLPSARAELLVRHPPPADGVRLRLPAVRPG